MIAGDEVSIMSENRATCEEKAILLIRTPTGERLRDTRLDVLPAQGEWGEEIWIGDGDHSEVLLKMRAGTVPMLINGLQEAMRVLEHKPPESSWFVGYKRKVITLSDIQTAEQDMFVAPMRRLSEVSPTVFTPSDWQSMNDFREQAEELMDPDVALAKSYDPDNSVSGTPADMAKELKLRQQLRKHFTPLCYITLLPRLIDTARRHGYSLCVQGSLVRDLDLVAVPWVDDASSAVELVDALVSVCGGVFVNGGIPSADGKFDAKEGCEPTEKPHGRLSWTIHTGAELWIDLSVMPRTQALEAAP